MSFKKKLGINQIRFFLQNIYFSSKKNFSLYDIIIVYYKGINNGSISDRAASISFSFFLALFPFLLFLLNLIPFIPVDSFDTKLLLFMETWLPENTHSFINDIFIDIQNKPRKGLLSYSIIFSIYFFSNGINSIFNSFNKSYYAEKKGSYFKQRIFALASSLILIGVLLISTLSSIYIEIYEEVIKEYIGTDWAQKVNSFFSILFMYISIALIYFFGTRDKNKIPFFSSGALITTILLIFTSFLFSIYLNNFSNYNELYGSIGTLLILMLYIWINAIVLLIGFEINISIKKIKKLY